MLDLLIILAADPKPEDNDVVAGPVTPEDDNHTAG